MYVELNVRVSNMAMELYKSMGFRISEIEKNYYEKPVEDAYKMVRDPL